MGKSARPLFSALFFLSGMAGLVYEVCWTRLLRLPMGNTIYSLTAVLTAFMAGLALGSFVAGRRIDRHGHPLRVYAILEAAIGVFCLVLPWIVQAEQPLFRWVYQNFSTSFLAFHLFKFIACGVVILVPATLMGATLPVLCRYFMDDPERVGLSLGWLYAVNALGAVAGSLLAGFALIPKLGLHGAMLAGVATSLTVAGLAWVSQSRFRYVAPAPPGMAPASAAPRRGEPHAAAPRSGRTEPLSRGLRRLVLVGYALSGAAAMVLQIAWARVLSLVIGSSVYAFALLVSAFILGLAIGSTVASRFADRLRRPALGFAFAELAIGVTALAMVPVFQHYPEWMLRIVPEVSQNFGRFQLVQFALVFLTLLLPTACMGMCLPLVGRTIVRGLEHAAEEVGVAYSANALGTIAGAFLGGFVLLPQLGMYRAILTAAGLNMLVAVALLATALPRRRALPLAGGVAVASLLALFLSPRFDTATLASGAYLYADRFRKHVDEHTRLADLLREEYSILMYEEGLTATVVVKESSSGARLLTVNGKTDASDDTDMQTQLLLGHVPLLLHPAPRDVAVVGLASGVTVHSVALHPAVRSIDCIEIAPEMVHACRFFDHVNGHILDDPRLHLRLEDGRNHLTLTNRKYDVILSQPTNPWIAGVANLFTREYLQACGERLNSGGLMCLWLQLYGLDETTLRSISRTFLEVFPNASLWETVFAGDYLLVGAKQPIVVGWDELASRCRDPKLAESLGRLGIRTPEELLIRQVGDAPAVRAFAAPGEIYTDDRNALEFTAPRLLHHQTQLAELQAIQSLRHAGLPEWVRPPANGLGAGDAARLAATQAAQGEFWQGMQRRAVGHAQEATLHFLKALELDPHLGSLPQMLLETARGVATMRAAAGDTAKAIGLYEQIVARNPELPEFHNQLGVWLAASGRFAEAEVEYRKATELDPRNLYMRRNLALALARQGKLAEAEPHFRMLVERRPQDVRPRLDLANLLIDRDPAAAERECRAALAASPRSPDAWALLGETLYRQASYRPAAEAIETALRHGSTAQSSPMLLAECYRKLGENDKAALVAARYRNEATRR